MSTPQPVLVVDFGAQYSQLIARRIREAKIYSEVIPHTATLAEFQAKNPAAIVLSGGPASVYADGAPTMDPAVLEMGVPVFGICYGFQFLAKNLGGVVSNTGDREYGRTEMSLQDTPAGLGGILHGGLEAEHKVWMSHGDAVLEAPAGCTVTASTPGAPVAAFEDTERRIAGVQYHPEVMHSPHGQEVLVNFLTKVAGLSQDWTTENIVDQLVAQVKEQIGSTSRAICGLSGGVDSAVAAALVQRAIGDRLTCVFVDHGLLRAGEKEQVQQDFVAATGARLVTIDAVDKFLTELDGVTDPEAKRKTIGRLFIRSFEDAVSEVLGEALRKAPPSISWYKVRSTRMWWNPVAVRVPPTLSPTTTWAGCQKTSSSPCVSRSVCSSKMRCVQWAANWGCRRSLWAASRSPAPVWVFASSEPSPASVWRSSGQQTSLPAPNSPTPGSTTRSGSARWCY